jgi:hypothetical protein
MNIQNLTQEEIKNLHTLLGKMLGEPKQKVYLDPLNRMVDEILESFDFNKVHKAMKALNWTGACAEEGVPNIDELKETAEYLLRGAAEYRLSDKYNNVYWETPMLNATGGFEAKAWCDETKTRITGLQLQFVLAEYDSE